MRGRQPGRAAVARGGLRDVGRRRRAQLEGTGAKHRAERAVALAAKGPVAAVATLLPSLSEPPLFLPPTTPLIGYASRLSAILFCCLLLYFLATVDTVYLPSHTCFASELLRFSAFLS